MNRDAAHRDAAATACAPGRDRTGDRVLLDRGRRLYAVADGIGDARHGARSAQLVVDELPALLDASGGDLAAAVAAAQRRLWHVSRHWVGGSGTTLVCARVLRDHITVVHVGDSKAYLLRDGRLDALTTDHTLAQVLVDAGRIDPGAVRGHPDRSRLVRHVGMAEASPPDHVRTPVHPGDRLLLCSDGLVDGMAERGIRAVLAAGLPADETCRELLDGARSGDDTAVVVVDVENDDTC